MQPKHWLSKHYFIYDERSTCAETFKILKSFDVRNHESKVEQVKTITSVETIQLLQEVKICRFTSSVNLCIGVKNINLGYVLKDDYHRGLFVYPSFIASKEKQYAERGLL